MPSMVGRAAASWAVSTGTAMINQAAWTDEGLTRENFDNVIADSSKYFAVSYGSSVVGGEIGNVAVGGGGGGNRTVQSCEPLQEQFSDLGPQASVPSEKAWTPTGLKNKLENGGMSGVLHDIKDKGVNISAGQGYNRDVTILETGDVVTKYYDKRGEAIRVNGNVKEIILNANMSDEDAAAVLVHEWGHLGGLNEEAARGLEEKFRIKIGAGSGEPGYNFRIPDGVYVNYNAIERAVNGSPMYNTQKARDRGYQLGEGRWDHTWRIW